ncbi:MAG: hypothetical protein O3B73_02810, partial [bacterium]|nr:hypothetical protein [bacterium]
MSPSSGPKKIPSFLTGPSPESDARSTEKSGKGMDREIKQSRWTLRRIGTLAVVTFFVVAVLYLAILGDRSAKLNVQIDRVTVSQVIRGPFQEFIVQRGTVMPIQSHYLDALEGGQVEEIYVEEGALLKAGAAILRLSNPTTEQRVMNQEATLFEQITNMENMRLNLESQAIQNRQQLMQGELDLQQTERIFNQMTQLHARGLESEDRFLAARENYEHAKKLREFMVQTVKQDSISKTNRLASLERSA